MYPIYSTKNGKDIDKDEMLKELKKTCIQHRGSKRALAFAFILYNWTNEVIPKILKDKDYWIALNELSGKYLTLFYLNSSYKKLSDIEAEQIQNDIEIESLTELKVDNLDKNTESLIYEYFEFEKEIKMPCILFFQVEDKYILDYYVVELLECEKEKAYHEIKGLVEEAVTALKYIQPENYFNNDAIFREVKTAIVNRKERILANKIASKIPFMGVIKSLLNYI